MRLTQRERLLTVVSVILVAAWSAFTFVVKPAIARTETLSRVIPQKQQELETLRAKSREHSYLHKNFTELRVKLESQDSRFELLPFLELLIQQQNLKDNLSTMKQRVLPLDTDYSEFIVEVQLESMTLSRLIDFLSSVDSPDNLTKITTVHIKKNPVNSYLLDCVVEIHSPNLSQSRLKVG